MTSPTARVVVAGGIGKVGGVLGSTVLLGDDEYVATLTEVIVLGGYDTSAGSEDIEEGAEPAWTEDPMLDEEEM